MDTWFESSSGDVSVCPRVVVGTRVAVDTLHVRGLPVGHVPGGCVLPAGRTWGHLCMGTVWVLCMRSVWVLCMGTIWVLCGAIWTIPGRVML